MTKARAGYILVVSVLVTLSIAGAFAREASRDADPAIVGADVAWMLMSTALVLLMTPGLAFFYGGMVGSRSVISTLLQNVVAMGIISIMWVVFGFSLAFGEDSNHFYGKLDTYWMFQNVGLQTDSALSPTIPLILFALFQMKFAIITPALITGSFAERIRFAPYMVFIALWHIVVYCPLAHWTWHPEGFLRKWGVLDFAGGTVVHMSSGFAALAGAIVLGRRKSHVEKEKHVPANIPFVVLGMGLLWFGWFGFNAGSALAANAQACSAFLTTNTSAAMAMMTWLFIDGALGRKLTATGACVGAVVGLVAITPACGFVSVQRSFFIGFFGALVSNLACWVKSKTSLDDTLDVFPCHGMGGMTGMVLTGFFASDLGVVSSENKTFGYHWLGLAIVAGYSFVVSFLLYHLVNLVIPLRVERHTEEQGLDVSQHGETLYVYDDLDGTMYSTQSGAPLSAGAGSVDGFRRGNSGLPRRPSNAFGASSQVVAVAQTSSLPGYQPPPPPPMAPEAPVQPLPGRLSPGLAVAQSV